MELDRTRIYIRGRTGGQPTAWEQYPVRRPHSQELQGEAARKAIDRADFHCSGYEEFERSKSGKWVRRIKSEWWVTSKEGEAFTLDRTVIGGSDHDLVFNLQQRAESDRLTIIIT